MSTSEINAASNLEFCAAWDAVNKRTGCDAREADAYKRLDFDEAERLHNELLVEIEQELKARREVALSLNSLYARFRDTGDEDAFNAIVANRRYIVVDQVGSRQADRIFRKLRALAHKFDENKSCALAWIMWMTHRVKMRRSAAG